MKSSWMVKIAVGSLVVCVIAFSLFWLMQTGRISTKTTQNDEVVLSYKGTGKAAVNQEYNMSLMLNSGSVNVNAAGIYLKFDPEKLKVTKIDTLNSFCQFYPEKKFDNNMGTISLACGSPHPGYRGESELIKVTFLPVATGTTNILMDTKSSILKSDGKSTNLLNKFPIAEVQIGVGL